MGGIDGRQDTARRRPGFQPVPRFFGRHGRACPGHPRDGCRAPALRASTNVMQGGWVYIVTSRPNGTLYIGVTSNLARRAWEHREGVAEGFTKRYGLKILVYAERHDDIRTAIQRERNLKHWSRAWKVRLILADNPDWNDLYDQLV
jgi:putative endonuclease